jgi:hypothetical protein
MIGCFGFWKAFSTVISNLVIHHKLELLEVCQNEKMVAIAVFILVLASMFGGVMTVAGLADENYEDHSQEFSEGQGEAPEDDMAREEPRLRLKDI